MVIINSTDNIVTRQGILSNSRRVSEFPIELGIFGVAES